MRLVPLAPARPLPGVDRRQIALVLAGALAVAAAARVAIPLPFTPVPLTLQTTAVVLVGATLGARAGAAAVLTYLAAGLSGLPVFAGGQAGPAVLLGPTGGYLVGFVVSASLAGWLVERGWGRSLARAALAFLVADLAIYLTGLPRLAAFVGAESAVPLGLLAFLPGDLVKVGAAALLWRAGSRGGSDRLDSSGG